MTAKQILGTLLLSGLTSLIGAFLAIILFGVAFWILHLFGLIEKTDAIVRVKVVTIACMILGFVLGIIRAIKMMR